MAMERFQAPALPVPPVEYDQRYHTDLIRILRLYFNQLDSLTPNQANSYRADNFTYSIQFINTANDIHYATVWLKVNNSDIPNSATIFTVPARKSASPGEEGYVVGYSEITFEIDAGDEIELYWATDLAGNPTTPTDGVYLYHDTVWTTPTNPYARPAIPSVIGSITFVSAINKPKVAPLPVYGYGQVGVVTVTIGP
jgi:hypothetical protein